MGVGVMVAFCGAHRVLAPRSRGELGQRGFRWTRWFPASHPGHLLRC